jgi:hypothetical protein
MLRRNAFDWQQTNRHTLVLDLVAEGQSADLTQAPVLSTLVLFEV